MFERIKTEGCGTASETITSVPFSKTKCESYLVCTIFQLLTDEVIDKLRIAASRASPCTYDSVQHNARAKRQICHDV